ncbi:MAG: FecR domain-containing protein, partial [Chloroflexi bacterium]|nr:FecR domain-containing protein [Chloroflexota bacterium]
MTNALTPDRDMERLAWILLFSAFAVFLVLLFGIPALGIWYINTATDSHEADLSVWSGTAIVEVSGREPSAEQASRSVPEGATIRTDANTRATLKLFDGSTVIIYPDTQVTLSAARTPRFSASTEPPKVQLALRAGQLRVTAAPNGKGLDLSIQTPNCLSQLQPGDYLLEVAGEQTDLIARSGRASVKTNRQAITLSARERGQVKDGELRGPLPLERNLIANGDFAAPLAGSWRVYNDQGGDAGNVDGTAQIETVPGRSADQPVMAVHFARQNSNGNHDETGIEQLIGKDVSEAEGLRLRVNMWLNYQSLSGGGYLSSEYPLMIRMNYRDVAGGQTFWVRGFFYQNDAHTPTPGGEQVPQAVWVTYESPNLTEILKPKPS